jgi:ATP-dependent exoDNAse (exonuclease V) alpha subunit
MYEHLKHAYLLSGIHEGSVKSCRIGKIYVKIGDVMTLTENINEDYVNGDNVIIHQIRDGNEVEITKDNPQNNIIIDVNKLLPYNFITCHKAQGRTIPKIILIIDDLFEITMLYTAITRALDDVKFIQFKNKLPQTFNDDLNAFKIMRDVIYHKDDEDVN